MVKQKRFYESYSLVLELSTHEAHVAHCYWKRA